VRIELPDVMVLAGVAAIVAALWMYDIRLGIAGAGVAVTAWGIALAMMRARRAG